jgi:cellulose synthase/poly-beta-1,6-N-acetylglucosamine synthase-like glycosyltransferase
MRIIMIIILVVYFTASLFIFLYSLTQASLVWKYYKKRRKFPLTKDAEEDFRPKVTIQLPLYNELYVVERLIDKVCEIKYPRDKFEIQVLDDSTDETTEIAQRKVDEWKSKGLDIKLVHRTNRKGYKAGALEEGLELISGEFVAIFDADFMPDADFLLKTVPHFSNSNVGMVQTRWGHINRNYSLLTRLQAFALDAHFTIEQVGRNATHGFINFNGTAGIWRKSCIYDSGNWSPDTLTEDLDLSYRAQLKNWEFIYLEDVESPAELPPVMSALKTQQYRWTKGGAETAKKHLPNVIRSDKKLSNKWHGIMHLLNSSVFISIVVCAILSIPLQNIKPALPEFGSLFTIASVFLVSFLVLAAYYFTAILKVRGAKLKSILEFIFLFPLFLAVSMGLSLHNSIAVIEGYMGRKSSFVRTPKFNLNEKKDKWTKNLYIPKTISWLTALEGLLAIYFAYGIVRAFQIEDYGLLPFHAMMFAGYTMVFVYSTFQYSKGT